MVDTIFDIGMYDGADTRHFLETGHRVIAVEANPALAAAGARDFREAINAGLLTIVNRAITESGEPATLRIFTENLGGSSIVREAIGNQGIQSEFTVEGIRMVDLLRTHENGSRPKFVKVDIEGADGNVVLSLQQPTRPKYLSFEVGSDFPQLLQHTRAIGYQRFKLIEQNTFREMTRQRLMRDVIRRKVVRLAGFEDPQYLWRNGRYFAIGRSSGPAPWESDGPWRDFETVWDQYETTAQHAKTGSWFDCHCG
jgi:FkbM family methyltransferase